MRLPRAAWRVGAGTAATLAAAAALSGTATAAPQARVVTLPAELGTRVRAPAAFHLAGVHWRGAGEVRIRASRDGVRWTRFAEVHRGSPAWTGRARYVEVRRAGAGAIGRIRVTLVTSPPADAPARASDAVVAGRRPARPAIVFRRGWGADESMRRDGPFYSDDVRMVFVHHTVTLNGYSCASSAAIVRGIYAFHVRGNGWSDIGYNFLVDRCGRIFEGRFGGITRPVLGAHTLGFNTSSVGIALIGTHSSAAPSAAALSALRRLIAWRLDLVHVDPTANAYMVSRGNPRHRTGRLVRFRAVSGHRDAYGTECPGAALYRLLPGIAAGARATGGPKIWAPDRDGKLRRRGPGSVRPLRFEARFSATVTYRVRVVGPGGLVVWSRRGRGSTLDRTWRGAGPVMPAGDYRWELDVPGARGVVRPLGTLVPWRETGRPTALDVAAGTATAGGLESLQRVDGDRLEVDGEPVRIVITGAAPTRARRAAAARAVGARIRTAEGGRIAAVALWDWADRRWRPAGTCETVLRGLCQVERGTAGGGLLRYSAATGAARVRARFTVPGPVSVDASRIWIGG